MSDTKSNYQTRSKNAKRKIKDQHHDNLAEKRKNVAKPKKRRLTNKKATTQGEIIDAVDEILCYKCGYGHDEENLLLCDNCPRGFHKECLDPPLISTPSSAWWCPICTSIIPVYDDEERKFDLKDIIPGYTEQNFPLEAWKKIVLYLRKEEQLSLRLVNRFFDNLVSNTIFYRLTSKLPLDNLLKFRHPWAVKEFLIHNYDEKTGISMKKLGEILQRFSNIELLDIHGENFTSQALEIVGKYLLNIKALHFNFSNRISSLPISAKFGTQFGKLECVELDYYTIPHRPYLYDLTLVKKFLTELINLKHIQFQLIDTKSCKSLWNCISQCSTLESLGIQFKGDWDFFSFTSIKHIKHLNLEAIHTEVEQDFEIQDLDNLKSIILKLGEKMKNFRLVNCKNLDIVDISSSGKITSVEINGCPNLKELYLYGIDKLILDSESSNFNKLTIGDINHNDDDLEKPYINLVSDHLTELNLLNVYSHLVFETPNLMYLSIDFEQLEQYQCNPRIEFKAKLSKLIRLQLINIGYNELLDDQFNQILCIGNKKDKDIEKVNGETSNPIDLDLEPVIWIGKYFFEQLNINYPLLETLKVIIYGDEHFNLRNRRVFIKHPNLRSVILKNIDLGGEESSLPKLSFLKMTSNLAASSLLNRIDQIAPNIQFIYLDLNLLPKTKINSKSLTHLDIISSPLDSNFSLECPNLTYLKIESNLLEADLTKLISDKKTPRLEEVSITSTSDQLTPIKGIPSPKIRHNELKYLYIGSVIREQGIEIVCPSLRDLKIILEEDSDKFKFSNVKVPKLAWAVCYPQRVALDLKKHSLNEDCKLIIAKKK